MATKIPWCDETWNVITGCTPCSEGCENCYAKRMAPRLAGRFGYPADDPFRVTFHKDRLDEPTRWKKPRRVFVCSMGDLWHPDVRIRHRAAVLRIIEECSQHHFLCLTKRPQRVSPEWPWMQVKGYRGGRWPDNVWFGVTTENQRRANERIPLLLKTQAAVRFISIEPMLGPVDLGPMAQYPSYELDWVIIGCESGPKRRPCSLDWVRSAVDDCVCRRLPVFVKQLDIDGRVSREPNEWPEWARRQEFPTTHVGAPP